MHNENHEEQIGIRIGCIGSSSPSWLSTIMFICSCVVGDDRFNGQLQPPTG